MNHIDPLYYPSSVAPLTTELMRIMQYELSGETKGIIYGLDAIKLQNNLYKVIPGAFVKDGLVVKIEDPQVFYVTNPSFEILIKFDTNSLFLHGSNPKAEINIYNIGTYNSDPSLYIRVATIQNNEVKYNLKIHRQIYRTIIVSSQAPTESELRTQGIYWLNPYCSDENKALVSIWTSTEWKPVFYMKCIDPNKRDFEYTLSQTTFRIVKNRIQTVPFQNIIRIINDYDKDIEFTLRENIVGLIYNRESLTATEILTNRSIFTFSKDATLEALSSIVPGTYTLTFVARSEDLEKTVNATLIVEDEPRIGSFRLVVTGCSEHRPGDTFELTLKAVTDDGFYGNINVTFDYPTSDITLDINSAVLTIPQGATESNIVTINATLSSSSTSRNIPITFTGTANDSSSHRNYQNIYACTIGTLTGSFRLVVTGCDTQVTRGTSFTISVKAVAIDGFTGTINVTMNYPLQLTTTTPNTFTLVISPGQTESQTRTITFNVT